MADFLKLFHDKRLSTSEPEHLKFIKGRLADMKAENDKFGYEHFSNHYGVSVDVQITKEPEAKKKKGRPAK